MESDERQGNVEGDEVRRGMEVGRRRSTRKEDQVKQPSLFTN